MSFAKLKQDILDALGVVDYSPKGSVDREIVPLVNLVNAHPRLVTTSSCAGRVSVFIEGTKAATRIGGKGDGGAWLFVAHSPDELDPGWVRGLEAYTHPSAVAADEPRRYVLYKFEPFILHVRAADTASANALYAAAMACGFRESGIGPHNLVAVRISMRLDVPVGVLEGDRVRQLVPAEYLDELDVMSRELFAKNFRRVAELTARIEGLLESANVPAAAPAESKDVRRERKRREGLARQQAAAAAAAAAAETAEATEAETALAANTPADHALDALFA